MDHCPGLRTAVVAVALSHTASRSPPRAVGNTVSWRLILGDSAPSPFLHCRYNLDPFESHSDEVLWQVLERTFMRDTVGLWGCAGGARFQHHQCLSYLAQVEIWSIVCWHHLCQ